MYNPKTNQCQLLTQGLNVLQWMPGIIRPLLMSGTKDVFKEIVNNRIIEIMSQYAPLNNDMRFNMRIYVERAIFVHKKKRSALASEIRFFIQALKEQTIINSPPVSKKMIDRQTKLMTNIVAQNQRGKNGHRHTQKVLKALLGSRSKYNKLKLCDNTDCIKFEACKFKICKGCKIAVYCSRNCQKKHWKTHKLLCSELQIDLLWRPKLRVFQETELLVVYVR